MRAAEGNPFLALTPVFIGASWCAPCRQTYPRFAAVCSALGLEGEYLDVEYGDARSADVRSVPTIRVYADGDPYGAPLAEHVGGASEAQIRELIERAAARAL
jgi:thioredoxin-like negative regulator of GroEL